MPGGGWLSAVEADDLLRCYGIPMVEFRRAEDAGAAIDAALGGHVVIKADVPGLLHKTAAGAVELDLHGAGEVRRAMRRLRDKFAARLSVVLVEPMITGGTETIAGIVQEPLFGPVAVFGLGGVNTEAPVTARHPAQALRLADQHPEVAELDLNPVIARPDGAVAVDARIRVTSHDLADPFLRQLPLSRHDNSVEPAEG